MNVPGQPSTPAPAQATSPELLDILKSLQTTINKVGEWVDKLSGKKADKKVSMEEEVVREMAQLGLTKGGS